MENSMMLVQSTWNGEQTFRMVPIHKDCPYVECICDPTTKVFVVISTITKNTFHMVPKLDDNGDTMFVKNGKRQNGKMQKEERRQCETFQEFYLEDINSVIDIVKHFALNEKTFKFKWKEFLKDKPKEESNSLAGSVLTGAKTPEIIT